MPTSHDALLEDFITRPPTAGCFERLIQLVRTDPEAAARFAVDALDRAPKGGTFFDLTLSFVSRDDLELLLERALHQLRTCTKHQAAESVIAYTALQFPVLLHPHLEEIFTRHPNARTCPAVWPWRETTLDKHANLLSVIGSSALRDERERAWRCMLESRDPRALVAAIELTARVSPPHPLRLYLHEVGFDAPERKLYASRVSHLHFPASYFVDERPVWNDRSFHPTWGLGREGMACRFGGDVEGSCALCSGPLHHLVTVPRGASPFDELQRDVTLATCLSCLGWERQSLSYSHDTPRGLRCLDTGTVKPQFPAVALKETTACFVPTPERWQWQDWGLANGRENLNRLGGHPTWVQSAAYPDCPSCKDVMSFLLQLDSNLPTADEDEWLWGSGGACYAFWCRGCSVSTLLWQCT